jgi:hypothetical protein
MPDVSFSSLGAVSAGTAAAFVAAGLLSALIFPVHRWRCFGPVTPNPNLVPTRPPAPRTADHRST